jgi:hypothetical protein
MILSAARRRQNSAYSPSKTTTFQSVFNPDFARKKQVCWQPLPVGAACRLPVGDTATSVRLLGFGEAISFNFYAWIIGLRPCDRFEARMGAAGALAGILLA